MNSREKIVRKRMNRASGTCGTTITDLFISSEFQKEKDKRLKLKKVLEIGLEIAQIWQNV